MWPRGSRGPPLPNNAYNRPPHFQGRWPMPHPENSSGHSIDMNNTPGSLSRESYPQAHPPFNPQNSSQRHNLGTQAQNMPPDHGFYPPRPDFFGQNRMPPPHVLSQFPSRMNLAYPPPLPRPSLDFGDMAAQPPNISAENISEQSRERNQEKNDQEFISSWLQSKDLILDKEANKSKNNVLICREKLCDVIFSIEQLKKLQTKFENNKQKDDDVQSVIEIKKKLETAKTFLQDRDFIDEVKKRLLFLQKKKTRRLKQKHNEKVIKEDILGKRAEKHCKINAALDAIQLKQADVKKAKEITKAADSVLSEVRKKLSDCQRWSQLLKALQKLRQLRKKSAEEKGLYTPIESDKIFESCAASLESRISVQNAEYKKEEETLQVMLDMEKAENEEKERMKSEQELEEKKQQKKDLLEKWLFGSVVHSETPSDPFQAHYLASEFDICSLIQIRHEWDMFLATPSMPGASRIPSKWVQPSEPSSDGWAVALEKT